MSADNLPPIFLLHNAVSLAEEHCHDTALELRREGWKPYLHSFYSGLEWYILRAVILCLIAASVVLDQQPERNGKG